MYPRPVLITLGKFGQAKIITINSTSLLKHIHKGIHCATTTHEIKLGQNLTPYQFTQRNTTAQHSTAQHSTAQHSTAQHSKPDMCQTQVV